MIAPNATAAKLTAGAKSRIKGGGTGFADIITPIVRAHSQSVIAATANIRLPRVVERPVASGIAMPKRPSSLPMSAVKRELAIMCKTKLELASTQPANRIPAEA